MSLFKNKYVLNKIISRQRDPTFAQKNKPSIRHRIVDVMYQKRTKYSVVFGEIQIPDRCQVSGSLSPKTN